MTQNQIAYWNLQETKRSNESREKETNRHNVVTEQEAQRHNTVSEGETYRHNTETERFNISQLQETQRHNEATENLGSLQLNESIRHNTVTEQQNAIANAIKSQANAINEAYNNAIAELRSKELTLAREKEIQRISESKRDFDEAVRMNDAKLIIDAYKSGNDTVRTIFGNKGIIGAGVLGGAAVGAALKPDLLKRPSGVASTSSNSGTAAMSSTAAGIANSGRTFDLFLVPNVMLDYYQNTRYGSGPRYTN